MYPDFIKMLPLADVNFPGAEARLISGSYGQVAFWRFEEGGSVPPHRHGAQLGIVLRGQVTLTVEGVTHTWQAGDVFNIDENDEHSATVAPGTYVVEVYQESDRHRELEQPTVPQFVDPA
ncbi:hypothetical protein ACM01_17755 [Streptomyces viridochromogenes]|uniref:Cupin type-2 domain-containing protein n=3 Tax=Streptomyces viridochromogenes TaxID=1938 RepID=A0A0J7ZCR3_STRVR|nr:hypothetical protein ACM01_17755 [Streptomyces viridochromogenes]KOG07905.1 hypothetical protein ADK36_44110 [Streptomyces viridochromogenes]KOG28337.1 hypothetical protein ADK35_03745 [Streptomyces viridochromogenes]